MGSLIAYEAEEQGLRPSEDLEVDFGCLLHRYLEPSRDVIIGNAYNRAKD